MKIVRCSRCGNSMVAGKRRICLACNEEIQGRERDARAGRCVRRPDDIEERIKRLRELARRKKPLFGGEP